MLDEYLKWTIILVILRVPLESLLQAFLIRKKKIICKVDNDIDIAYEWTLRGLQGRGFSIVQVAILILGVICTYQTLYSKLANAGYFGPHTPFVIWLKNKFCQILCCRKPIEPSPQTSEPY